MQTKVPLALFAIAVIIASNVLPASAQTKPTHSEIQAVLDLADRYIRNHVKQSTSNQYQEVPNSNQAVIAEYPSIPIKIVRSDGVTIRAGEDTYQGLNRSNYIENVQELDSNRIRYDLGFRYVNSASIHYHNVPKLRVTVNWNHSTDLAQISIQHIAWDNVVSYADLYLHGLYIARLNNSTVNQTWTFTITKDNALLNSFRYIERHGVQLAYEYFTATGNTTLANKMSTRLTDRGYSALLT